MQCNYVVFAGGNVRNKGRDFALNVTICKPAYASRPLSSFQARTDRTHDASVPNIAMNVNNGALLFILFYCIEYVRVDGNGEWGVRGRAWKRREKGGRQEPPDQGLRYRIKFCCGATEV